MVSQEQLGYVYGEGPFERRGQVLTFERHRQTHRHTKTTFTRCGGNFVSARQIMASPL